MANLDNLIDTLREIKRSKAKIEKLRSITLSNDVSVSGQSKANTDLTWEIQNLARLEHKAHCLCVVLEFADEREPYHYFDEVQERGNGFQQYPWRKSIEDSIRN